MKKLPLLLLGFLFCASRTSQTAVVVHLLNLSFSASINKDLSKKLSQGLQVLLPEFDRMAGYNQMQKMGSRSHVMAETLPSSKSDATLTALKYSADDQAVGEQNGPSALLAKEHSETFRKT